MPSTSGLQIVRVAPAVSSSTDVAAAVSDAFPPHAFLGGARSILNQQQVPCCVSCSFVTAMESANPSWPDLAPLFHYFLSRTEQAHSAPSQPINLTLEQGGTVVERSGVSSCILHTAAMDLLGMATPPTSAARQDALTRRLPPISVLPPVSRIELLADGQRILAWKGALLRRRPIIAGFDLPVGYGPQMTQAPWPAARRGDSHACAILGYDDSKASFVVQDSQGPDWFMGGQWYMPYAYAQSGFVYRAYSLRLN